MKTDNKMKEQNNKADSYFSAENKMGDLNGNDRDSKNTADTTNPAFPAYPYEEIIFEPDEFEDADLEKLDFGEDTIDVSAFDEGALYEDKTYDTSRTDKRNNETDTVIDEEAIPVRTDKKGIFKKLSDALRGKKYLFLCFLVPALIMTLIYVFMGAYPFGNGSVLVLDLNGQYVYYFEALRDIITEGGSLLYSFRRALGGEFMGIFAYYLSSPLSLIVALFPKEYITEALYFMFVLKCGLCGFTFGLYVHKTRPRNPVSAVMFSSMYALCSYAVVMQHNTMWTDNLILLPLIMLGIERLIKKGGIFGFVIPLTIAVFSNFYIGYMMCIFSAAYFFFYYFSRTPEDRNPLGIKKHFVKSFSKFALGGLLAVCICAIIILPTYYSLTFGKTDFSTPKWVLTQKFDFADMLTKLFFGSYDTVRPEGLPFLYTGTLTLLLVPSFFISKKISTREKIASAALIVFFIFSMNASTLDLIWHGMQKPNWLNYRYAFMLAFFLVYMAFRTFEHIKEIKFGYVAGSAAGVIALLLVLQKFEYENLPDLTAVWVSIGAVLIYLAILTGTASKKEVTHSTAAVALVIIVCFELFSAGLVNLFALDNDVKFSGRTGYRTHVDELRKVVADIKESDSSFYRTEKTVHRKTNDNLALDINGLSNSTSTLNAETIEFLNRMGFSSKSHWSKYLGRTPVADSILGIRYLITDKEEEVDFYEPVKEYDSIDYRYYKNPYALSLVYGVSPLYTNASIGDDGSYPSPPAKMNTLVNHMLGEPKGDGVFTGIDYDVSTTSNLSEVYVSSHIKYEPVNKNESASVTFFATAVYDGPLYCYFPSEYIRECTLFINGEQNGTYFGNETYRIVDLGTYSAGDTVTVRLELKKDNLYIWDSGTYFWQTNTERFVYAMEKLSESQLEITKHTDTQLLGNIDVAKDQTQIFTSIPYDEGWRVICDGKEVPIEKGADALITFTLPEGKHDLRLEYSPDCVKFGVIISAVSLAAAVLIGVSEILTGKASLSEKKED